MWLLLNIGPDGLYVTMDKSFLALFGGLLAPLLAPLGFGTWQAVSALITGFLAKESVVATMNIVYHAGSAHLLKNAVANEFTPLSAYSFLVFTLIYLPCLPAVATIRKETGSAKWTIFSVAYPLILAYIISFLIYQAGKLLGY